MSIPQIEHIDGETSLILRILRLELSREMSIEDKTLRVLSVSLVRYRQKVRSFKN